MKRKALKIGSRVSVRNPISCMFKQRGTVLKRYLNGHYVVRVDTEKRFPQGLIFMRRELTKLIRVKRS